MKFSKSVYRSLTMISQFGINMIVPIFLCSALGMFLDKKLGTSFIMIILFFIGAVAGFRNIYILAKKVMNHSDKEENRNARKNKEMSEDK